MKTILIVDPDPINCSQLIEELTNEGYAVTSVNNSQDALVQIQKLPDLLIMDTSISGVNNFDLIRNLKQNSKYSSIPIFLLSSKLSDADEIIGLEIGADDYLTKPVQIPRLLTRVRTFFRQLERFRKIYQEDQEIIEFNDFTILIPQYSIATNFGQTVFPKKEFELLVYLAKSQGRVITRKELYQTLWGLTGQTISRTIDVHISRVRNRLGPHAHCIVTVPGIGYRFQS